MTLSLLQQIILCSEKRFTGKLCVTNLDGNNVHSIDGNCWNLYFFRGRLVGDSAGIHPVRRLRRQFSQQQIDLSESIEERFFVSIDLQDRNYFVIKQLLIDNYIDQEQAEMMIEGSLTEVLFDILQYEATTEGHGKPPLTYLLQTEIGEEEELPAILIKPELILQQVNDNLRTWCNKGFLGYSPNLTPYINDPVVLQGFASAKSYKNMAFLLDGDRTLRDIAIKVDEDMEAVMLSTLKYRNLGFLSFRLMPDINPSEKKLTTAIINYKMPTFPASGQTTNKNSIVAHLGIDNQGIKTIIENAGHSYVNLQEFSRTTINLLQHQPDLILVDSLTTNINAQKFCGQIRRTNKFKKTPIVFFNNNAGVMGWLHQRMEHSTEYIAKHYGQQELLTVLNKYI